MTLSTLMAVVMAIPLFLVFAVAAVYNTLIGRRNQVENVFACLDALLQKRHDLIPNLVSTVKGAMGHEQKLLSEIARLRSRTMAGGTQQRAQADEQLSVDLNRLLMLAENYPALQANQNFLHLQASLTEIEEQISAARRAYNATVTDYNNGVEMFPTNIVAGWMELEKKLWFEATPDSRANVDIAAGFRE